jgi:AraC-like DNA-binding protein
MRRAARQQGAIVCCTQSRLHNKRQVSAGSRSLQRAPNRPLSELAAEAGLSPGRFRHLVAEDTGMPLCEHRLLQRTTLALEHMLGGASIASAACAVGFADHAHLTRTFKRLFGRTPSSMPTRSVLRASWAERCERGVEHCTSRSG